MNDKLGTSKMFILTLVDIDINPKYTSREEAISYLMDLSAQIDLRIEGLRAETKPRSATG